MADPDLVTTLIEAFGTAAMRHRAQGTVARADLYDTLVKALRLLDTDPNFWLDHGLHRGWCSEVACATHDGVPSTPNEDDAWGSGMDPCQPVVRLWPKADDDSGRAGRGLV